MAKKQNIEGDPSVFEQFHDNPHSAADALDATLHFLHRRYVAVLSGKYPQLGSLFINRLDVVFSDIPRTIIEKHWDKNTIEAIAPRVPAEIEEKRRAELLTLYSPMLVRCQVSALSDIYRMLISTLDEEARDTLLQEYRDFRRGIEQTTQEATSSASEL